MIKNNKGFTLVELLVVIVILALIVTVVTPVMMSTLNNSKDKSLEILRENILIAARNYYEECSFVGSDNDMCPSSDTYTIKLGKLVEYGFLSGSNNCSDGNCTKVIRNPKNNDNIKDCEITINEDNNSKICYNVILTSTTDECKNLLSDPSQGVLISDC